MSKKTPALPFVAIFLIAVGCPFAAFPRRGQTPQRAQNSLAPSTVTPQFWQQADELRPKLDAWKTTVDNLDFRKLDMGKYGGVILPMLQGDKQQVLHLLVNLWLQIPVLEKMTSPSQEYRVMVQIVWLQSLLAKLQSDLVMANAIAVTSGSMQWGDSDAQAFRVASSSINHMEADLGNNFNSRMGMQLQVDLTKLQIQLTQCQNSPTKQ